MTSVVQLPKLPEYLLTSWRLSKNEALQCRRRKDLKGWNASSLTEAYLKYQLGKYNHVQETQGQAKAIPPTLSSIAAGKVLDVLNTSDNFDADLRTIMRCLNSTTVRQLLADPRTPYAVHRAIQSFLTTFTPSKSTEEPRDIIDTDEAILANERYVRSRGEANRDNRYLVGLEQLSSVLLRAPESDIDDIKVRFVRKEPPKGGFEFLDAYRERIMHITPDDASFVRTFERITKGALKGLDWSNVLVAGGMALTTLVHIDPSKDDECDVRDCDIDLYLYGLTPDEANRKLEEIYDVWSRNLPPTNQQKLVVKNAKTFNLLPSYPNRRIQIILRLLSSPTQILLNFDLDACAIGFDGSRVLMLPRFARAVETGYSVFTMDLIWGHHLGDRRATQEKRVFKYADRGFGLRILPSYAKSLEEDGLDKELEYLQPKHQDSAAADQSTNGEEATESEIVYRSGIITQPERIRKPDGPEPGLKTLKRVAYLGQDFVNRFYFGVTPLTLPPGLVASGDSDIEIDVDSISSVNEDIWTEAFAKALTANKALREADESLRTRVTAQYGPLISFTVMDTSVMHGDLPDGRRGLGTFELFMRHCEAWRLDALAYAELDVESFASLTYDPESYDDMPTYSWDKYLNLDDFARQIDSYNDNLFHALKQAICQKLGINERRGGYSNYLTRRIRRQVYGPDLASVQEKQITIPLAIPWQLENFLTSELPNQYPDFPGHFTAFKCLIPVHDAATYDPATATLPSLQDTIAESGNLRYWVITNESMWAGQHRALDEISEVIWSFFHWFAEKPLVDIAPSNDKVTHNFCWELARSFRRRIVLPEVPADNICSAHTPSRRMGLPTLRESLLFRPWVYHTPKNPHSWDDREDRAHPLFDEDKFRYPFPDHLFWEEGDEGEWDEEGVPAWRVVGKSVKAGQGVRGRPWSLKLTPSELALVKKARDFNLNKGHL